MRDFRRMIQGLVVKITKEQLFSVLPLLVRHLGSNNYVCYTYAAITIDRVLFIKKNNQLM